MGSARAKRLKAGKAWQRRVRQVAAHPAGDGGAVRQWHVTVGQSLDPLGHAAQHAAHARLYVYVERGGCGGPGQPAVRRGARYAAAVPPGACTHPGVASLCYYDQLTQRLCYSEPCATLRFEALSPGLRVGQRAVAWAAAIEVAVQHLNATARAATQAGTTTPHFLRYSVDSSTTAVDDPLLYRHRGDGALRHSAASSSSGYAYSTPQHRRPDQPQQPPELEQQLSMGSLYDDAADAPYGFYERPQPPAFYQAYNDGMMMVQAEEHSEDEALDTPLPATPEGPLSPRSSGAIRLTQELSPSFPWPCPTATRVPVPQPAFAANRTQPPRDALSLVLRRRTIRVAFAQSAQSIATGFSRRLISWHSSERGTWVGAAQWWRLRGCPSGLRPPSRWWGCRCLRCAMTRTRSIPLCRRRRIPRCKSAAVRSWWRLPAHPS
jgi:hypothetical protein